MIKIYTKNKAEYLKKRYDEIMVELRKTRDYPYVCGQLEFILESVIKELKN